MAFGCVERFMLNTVDENTFRVLSCSSWIRFLVCRRAIHELHEVHGITEASGSSTSEENLIAYAWKNFNSTASAVGECRCYARSRLQEFKGTKYPLCDLNVCETRGISLHPQFHLPLRPIANIQICVISSAALHNPRGLTQICLPLANFNHRLFEARSEYLFPPVIRQMAHRLVDHLESHPADAPFLVVLIERHEARVPCARRQVESEEIFRVNLFPAIRHIHNRIGLLT